MPITRNRRTTGFAVALAATAGLVDALGFMHLHGFFVSFMSGNSTRLGIGLGSGDRASATGAGLLIGIFALGAMLGAVADHLAPSRRRRTVVLLLETGLLVVAALLHGRGFDAGAVAAMALAMGCENAVFVQDGRVSVGLTYMTGALVKTAHGIVAAAFGARPLAWVPDALLWLGLLGGAVAGAHLYALAGLDALWVAVVLAGACAAATLLDGAHLGGAA